MPVVLFYSYICPVLAWERKTNLFYNTSNNAQSLPPPPLHPANKRTPPWRVYWANSSSSACCLQQDFTYPWLAPMSDQHETEGLSVSVVSWKATRTHLEPSHHSVTQRRKTRETRHECAGHLVALKTGCWPACGSTWRDEKWCKRQWKRRWSSAREQQGWRKCQRCWVPMMPSGDSTNPALACLQKSPKCMHKKSGHTGFMIH